MNRVLFVDDEPNVLEGFKHALHPLRNTCEISICRSGDEALARLGRDESFDVIVSDLRMPGLSGSEFLTRVRERYPEIVRILLSARLDSETLHEASVVAHQVLTKPVDSEILREVLSRAFSLRGRVASTKVRKTLLRLGSLPSVPVLYWKILGEMSAPSPSIERVAQLVAKDPGLTSKVLRLANTRGAKERISNIYYATFTLGLENLKSFVLAAQLFSEIDKKGYSSKLNMHAQWEHCVAVGECARRIATNAGAKLKVIDESYTAGLLHDIGVLILAANLPDEFEIALELAERQGVTLIQAERTVVGATHPEVGAYLLDLWGLPEDVVKAISHHAFPSGYPEELYSFDADDEFTPLTAVHVANYFCEKANEDRNDYGVSELDMKYLEGAGHADSVESWWDTCFGLNA